MKQAFVALVLSFVAAGTVEAQDWFLKSSANLGPAFRNDKGQVTVKLDTLVQSKHELHSVHEPQILSLEADGKKITLPKKSAVQLPGQHNAKQSHSLAFDGVPANAKTISFSFKVKAAAWTNPGKLDLPVTSRKKVTAGCVELQLQGIEKDAKGHYVASLWLGTTRMYEVPSFTLVDDNGRTYAVESHGALDAEGGITLKVRFAKDDSQAAPATLRISHKGTPIPGEMTMSFENVQIFAGK